MDDAHLSPKDIVTPEDFQKIPPTEKKHYRKNFPMNVLAKGYSLKDKSLYRAQSSGTTGERLVTHELGFLFFQRAFVCISVYPTVHSAFYANPRKHIRYAAPNCSDVECANPNSTMQDRLLNDGTLVLSVYHDLLTTPDQILDQNIAEIEKYQPQMYYIDPTHMSFLLRHMRKHRYKPPKAPVFASYTLMTKISKRQIEEAFGKENPIIEFVSMSELGWLAVACPYGSLHINNKCYYIELICDNRPAEPGELAELYVTSIDRGCIPHIRYRTGDIYRFLGSKCKCGHDFPVIRMEGRLRNCLFRDGKIVLTPRELDDIIGDPVWMDLYKLIQTDEDDFLFCFIINEKYENNFENYIIKKLYQKLGDDINIIIDKTDYIPTERSGKFLSCLSTVGQQMIQKEHSL
jgi:phenylacetate-CoA ligase